MDPLLNYAIFFITIAGIYAVWSLALNVQWGLTGLFNIGIVAFVAVGGYTSVLLTVEPSATFGGGLGLPLAVGFIGAMVTSAILALLVGLITLNLRADYLAIATIGIAEIVRLFLKNEEWLTNGVRGIGGVPRAFADLGPEGLALANMILVLLCVLIVFLLVERARRAPWGRVLRAIRENELTVLASGKTVKYFRLQAFVFGAAIMGLGGALYSHFVGFISPEAFEPLQTTFLVWVMLIAGGSGNTKGAVLGAFIIWAIWSGSQIVTGWLPPELATQAGALRMGLIGLLLVLVLLFRNEGLLSEEDQRRADIAREARRDSR
ncbi:MAG: branched-chain amino acid ABC transporter permease [Kiloniellales bacterium]